MAGRIPRQFIDDLLSRVDIVDIIDRYVPLKKAGANYKACCPFHGEKTPSFSVNRNKQFYYCFGCGVHGTAIGFLMDFDHMHFVDAIEYLANHTGMQIPREAIQPVTQNQQNLYDILTHSSAFYCRELKNSATAISYLQQRGIDGETAQTYQLGFAPSGWNTLLPALGSAEKSLVDAGMLIRNESGKTHDRFRERIMFPIRDRRGRCIGFGGRVMGAGEPKYLNSPETALFQKGRELYGLYELRRSNSKKADGVIIVEGYMDVIALAQHGITNAVATLGTATSTDQVQLLFRESDDLYFCFDGDSAGRKAAWRALNSALPCLKSGRAARFLFLPDGEDPDSLVNSNGQAAFSNILNSAVEAGEFLFNEITQQAQLDLENPTASQKARAAELGKPLIEHIPQGIYRSLLEQRLTELVGTAVFSQSNPSQPRQRLPSKPHNTSAPTAVRKAIAAILEKPAIVLELDPELYDFSDTIAGAKLLMDIIALVEINPDIGTNSILEHYREQPEFKPLSQIAIATMDERVESNIEQPVDLLRQAIGQLNRQSSRLQCRELSLDKPPSQMTEEEKDEIRRRFNQLNHKAS